MFVFHNLLDSAAEEASGHGSIVADRSAEATALSGSIAV
jgi:hypothetical protein